MFRLSLPAVVARDETELVDKAARVRRQLLADGFDVAHRAEKAVRLLEHRVFEDVLIVAGRPHRIEVIRDSVDRDARAVILGIEEILKVARILLLPRHRRRACDRQAHELDGRVYGAHRLHNDIVESCVGFRRGLVLEIDLVQTSQYAIL